MQASKIIMIGEKRILAAAAALFVALALTLVAGPAGAATCHGCPDDGGGGGNAVPSISAANASVTVNEGQTATNTGTYSDADGNATVTLSASAGSVTKDASGDGTWSWSFRTTDGPNESQTVTITATDGTDTSTTTFSLTVNNVAPQVSQFWHTLPVVEGSQFTIGLNATDPAGAADPFTYYFDCDNNGVYEIGPKAGNTAPCTFGDSGVYRVNAQVSDGDGGMATASRNVTVDNVAPTATLEAPASADQGSDFNLSLTNASDPSSADSANLTYAFDCGDGSGYRAAGSAASNSCAALDQPTMTVKGRITDKDGGSNEYTREIAVNNVTPAGTIKINGGAAATRSTTVNLTLSATDPLPGSGVGHMRFRNENTEIWSDWEPYATSKSWLLSGGDGGKSVYVQYRDNSGNVSADEISGAIRLDTTTPNTAITSGPPSITRSTSARLGFSSSEAGSRFQCSLDGAAFTACASPKSYTNLKNGRHTFKVRAIDVAGNVDASPAARSWMVDTIKPVISGMSPAPGAVIRDTTPTIKATVRDNFTNLQKSNIKLYVNGALISPTKYSYNATTDVLIYNSPRLSKGKKTVKIVATDRAGNVGAKFRYFTIG